MIYEININFEKAIQIINSTLALCLNLHHTVPKKVLDGLIGFVIWRTISSFVKLMSNTFAIILIFMVSSRCSITTSISKLYILVKLFK